LRLGVISDTHARDYWEISPRVLRILAGVDLIVHAGDFTEKSVLDGLGSLGEVQAVHGNMDSGDIKRLLPSTALFEAGGKRVGLTHGSGSPWGIAGRVRKMFGAADIIIFGHSHQPYNQLMDGCLLFNPGCARNSCGIITIDDEVTGEIIDI